MARDLIKTPSSSIHRGRETKPPRNTEQGSTSWSESLIHTSTRRRTMQACTGAYVAANTRVADRAAPTPRAHLVAVQQRQ